MARQVAVQEGTVWFQVGANVVSLDIHADW